MSICGFALAEPISAKRARESRRLAIRGISTFSTTLSQRGHAIGKRDQSGVSLPDRSIPTRISLRARPGRAPTPYPHHVPHGELA